MERIEEILIEIIRCALSDDKKDFGEFDKKSLCEFASVHGLCNVLGIVIDDEMFNDIAYQSIAIGSKQEYLCEEILNACEEKGISVVPMKGICTKKRYQNPDIRTMGDVDILYKTKDDAKIREVMESLGFVWHGNSQKHDHYSKSYIEVEMHRSLVPAGTKYEKYFEDIWNRVVPHEGKKYICEMTFTDEFVYCMVHLAQHFELGGVGIRFIMDVYVYNHSGEDLENVKKELDKIGLLEFYNNITALSEKWFGDNNKTEPIIDDLEKYVLNSGLYGNSQNIKDVSVSDSRIKYLMKNAFPNYKRMKSTYSWLEKFPVLLPFAWIIRIITALFSKRKTYTGIIRKAASGNRENGKEIISFFKEIGLDL